MREIKFRMWLGKDMLHWEYIGEDVLKRALIERLHPIMQYTGLKDKNGKEIYEGDIVETDKEIRGEIRWNPYKALFYLRYLNKWNPEKGKYVHKSMPYVVKKCQIIGNIYENSELLSSAGPVSESEGE